MLTIYCFTNCFESVKNVVNYCLNKNISVSVKIIKDVIYTKVKRNNRKNNLKWYNEYSFRIRFNKLIDISKLKLLISDYFFNPVRPEFLYLKNIEDVIIIKFKFSDSIIEILDKKNRIH